MKNSVARQMLREYYEISNPTEDDEFRFVEALEYLIGSTKDPKYMCELGWFYCSKKRFDLEVKYLEMAAEYGYLPAFEELGYMYYYGQHGVTDYEKAFKYFSMGADEPDNVDNLWCRYKLADMYHNGFYVEQDEKKYRELIVLYELIPFDEESFDFYDLFYKADTPGKYSFEYEDERHHIDIAAEDQAVIINWDRLPLQFYYGFNYFLKVHGTLF